MQPIVAGARGNTGCPIPRPARHVHRHPPAAIIRCPSPLLRPAEITGSRAGKGAPIQLTTHHWNFAGSFQVPPLDMTTLKRIIDPLSTPTLSPGHLPFQ